jgi:hypothetical protein
MGAMTRFVRKRIADLLVYACKSCSVEKFGLIILAVEALDRDDRKRPWSKIFSKKDLSENQ